MSNKIFHTVYLINQGENKQVTSSYNIFNFLNFSKVCLFTVWCDVRAFFSLHITRKRVLQRNVKKRILWSSEQNSILENLC